jgi:Domain of unknown function (DUF3291)
VRIISVTRLRLRSIRFLPRLWWEIRKMRRALEKAPGFLVGKLLADRHWTFWTMTLWKDMESMRAFRDSGVHAAGMPHLARWCDEAAVVHWETEADRLPGWDEAYRRIRESGRPTPLTFPSEDYKACRYEAPHVSHHNRVLVLPRK